MLHYHITLTRVDWIAQGGICRGGLDEGRGGANICRSQLGRNAFVRADWAEESKEAFAICRVGLDKEAFAGLI